jgi:hypothetical protein
MTPERHHETQARQLLRLRELRQRQAESQARQARQAQTEALAVAQATQARVSAHQAERQALLQQIAQGALLVRWAAQAQACRDLVEDRLERAEYALIDDEETLHTRDRQLDQASLALRQARARGDAAATALDQARRRRAAADERRAEHEDPLPTALPPGAPR